MELDVFEDLLLLVIIILFIQLLFIYDLSTPMTSVKSRFWAVHCDWLALWVDP